MIDQKKILFLFVEQFFGERVMQDVLTNPSQPAIEIQQGEILLSDQLSDEEKFFYSIIPTEINGSNLMAVQTPALEPLFHLWWVMVQTNHKIFGPLGVRVGWKLVVPKPQPNPFQQIFTGMFETGPKRDGGDDKKFMS